MCIRIEREILSDRKKEYITKNYTRKYSSYDKAKNNYNKFKVWSKQQSNKEINDIKD